MSKKARVVGSLGDIVFKVSPKAIQTINNLEKSVGADYATHKIHNGYAKLEYTGKKVTKGSFDILLSAFLGVNPRKMQAQLERNIRNGKVVSFMMGEKKIGKQWVISDVKEKYTFFDGNGDVLAIECMVTIQGYH